MGHSRSMFFLYTCTCISLITNFSPQLLQQSQAKEHVWPCSVIFNQNESIRSQQSTFL